MKISNERPISTIYDTNSANIRALTACIDKERYVFNSTDMIITRALTCRVASASLPGYARSPLHSHPVGGKLLPDSLSENKSMTAITNQLFRIGAVK